MKKRTLRYNIGMLLLAGGMLLLAAGCSSDDTENEQGSDISNKDIRINVDVWRMMKGTRATTFDNATALQTEGSFTCYAYNGETTTAFIDGATVNWAASTWSFSDGKRYWPSGSLDFFAYMPATPPTYISAVSYATAKNPTITCTSLPMTSEGQADIKEFVYGLTTDQTKADQGESGVTMNFVHPFARIDFKLSASHPDITINSITLKTLKNNGTCSFNGTSSTWTPSGDATDFVMTLTDEAATFNNNPNTPQPIGGYAESAHTSIPLLMVPQDWEGEIEVNASWNDWGDTPVPHTVSTTIPAITWQPGYSYTYTFTISTDDLTVDVANYTEQW